MGIVVLISRLLLHPIVPEPVICFVVAAATISFLCVIYSRRMI